MRPPAWLHPDDMDDAQWAADHVEPDDVFADAILDDSLAWLDEVQP